MMDTPIFQTRDLCKDYQVGSQVVHALRSVTLEVAPGEFLAVMGPSGSGKSTFMNLLGCLDTPTSGSLLLEGNEVSALSSQKRAHIRNRRIGFVFQNFNLLARTSALNNVALPLRYARVPHGERIERAQESLAAVGLADRTGHHPSQLSGGQQQRVAIARALVNRPAIIMADEPTGALDTQTGFEVISLFQKLNSQGMTIVLVTHEPEIAAFARRLVKFRDGNLVHDESRTSTPSAEQALASMSGITEGV